MTMRFLKPVPITSSMLGSSNIAENDYAAWSGATTYSLGQRCISTTTHRIYESVQAGNLNHDPTTDTTATWWADAGPTNRWAMFDTSVGSTTVSANEWITISMRSDMVGALALLDMDAMRVRVTQWKIVGYYGSFEMLDQVYDRTFDLSGDASIADWYGYFFYPFLEPAASLLVDDLPLPAAGYLSINIEADTQAKCGTMAIGTMVDIGGLQYRPKIGIIDYSKKTADDYGNTSVVERAFAKRLECELWMDNIYVDSIARQLAAIRATPVVWVGNGDFNSLFIYGWARDWSITIAYPRHSIGQLTIEGLT